MDFTYIAYNLKCSILFYYYFFLNLKCIDLLYSNSIE